MYVFCVYYLYVGTICSILYVVYLNIVHMCVLFIYAYSVCSMYVNVGIVYLCMYMCASV